MDSWKVAIQKNAKKRCKKHDMFWGSVLREPKRKKIQKMKKTCFWSKSVFVCWGLIYKTADRPCHAFCKKSVIFGEPHFVTFPLENPWILITFGHFFDHFLTTFFGPQTPDLANLDPSDRPDLDDQVWPGLVIKSDPLAEHPISLSPGDFTGFDALNTHVACW